MYEDTSPGGPWSPRPGLGAARSVGSAAMMIARAAGLSKRADSLEAPRSRVAAVTEEAVLHLYTSDSLPKDRVLALESFMRATWGRDDSSWDGRFDSETLALENSWENHDTRNAARDFISHECWMFGRSVATPAHVLLAATIAAAGVALIDRNATSMIPVGGLIDALTPIQHAEDAVALLACIEARETSHGSESERAQMRRILVRAKRLHIDASARKPDGGMGPNGACGKVPARHGGVVAQSVAHEEWSDAPLRQMPVVDELEHQVRLQRAWRDWLEDITKRQNEIGGVWDEVDQLMRRADTLYTKVESQGFIPRQADLAERDAVDERRRFLNGLPRREDHDYRAQRLSERLTVAGAPEDTANLLYRLALALADRACSGGIPTTEAAQQEWAGLEARVLEMEMAAGQAAARSGGETSGTRGRDYGWFSFQGETFEFPNESQRHILKVLCEARGSFMHQDRVLTEASVGESAVRARLTDYFRGHPALGKLIVREKGRAARYALAQSQWRVESP